MRGDAVGVGLAVDGAALVGIGVVVVRGDGDDAAGSTQWMESGARVTRARYARGVLSRFAVRGPCPWVGA